MRTVTFLGCILLFLSAACAQSPSATIASLPLNGEKAMEHVRAQVEFGPRPAGSEELAKCRAYLIAQLERYGYTVEKDAFVATTPYGPKKMVNLIARTGPGDDGVIALASHYDTKYFEDFRFVGANDAGSSTGLLLELARVLAKRKDGRDYWFLFLDGEEAFVEWSAFDSTYGSRHLARRWKEDGTASRIRALLLLDMIGEKDHLGLTRDRNSTPWLMDLVWNTAQETGLSGILSTSDTYIEDDHIPFKDAGIPSVDIIDLDYTPWHTAGDTLDKVSPESLEKTGKLTLAVLGKLQKLLSGK